MKVETPVGQYLKVEGKHVVAVNWFDYRGWEVRTAIVQVDGQFSSVPLGYVHMHEEEYGETYVATPPGERDIRGFGTFERAVAALVKKEFPNG